MAEEFNKIARQSATRKAFPKCEMKAVYGDLIYPNLKPDSKAVKNRLTWDIDGEFEGFDMVVMCVSCSSSWLFNYFDNSADFLNDSSRLISLPPGLVPAQLKMLK